MAAIVDAFVAAYILNHARSAICRSCSPMNFRFEGGVGFGRRSYCNAQTLWCTARLVS